MSSDTPAELRSLDDGRTVQLLHAGVGAALDSDVVAPFESLHQLREQEWAVYRDGHSFRLHVSNGFQVELNGVVTGGAALETGDVIHAHSATWRFLDRAWPGQRHAGLDAQTHAAPHDDALAVVYRDWALERASAIASSLSRPVSRAEVARQLFSLAADVARGFVEASFAGPDIWRVTSRMPGLDLEAFVDALVRCRTSLAQLSTVRTVGLPPDDEIQLALLLARCEPLSHLTRLEVGQRGAWALADFRDSDTRAGLAVPREGLARPVRLVLSKWDGWTSIEPLTREGFVVLNDSIGLVPTGDEVVLGPAFTAPVRLLRGSDWVLHVEPSAPAHLRARWKDVPLAGSVGLELSEDFELVPGLTCHLSPEASEVWRPG